MPTPSDTPLRITFVLPHIADMPVGGYIVVYRYARELALLGHDVVAVHSRKLSDPTSSFDALKARLWPLRVAGLRGRRAPAWIDPLDRRSFRTIGALRWVRDADAVVATSWETAGPVAALPPSRGAKFSLIQHFEDWSAPDLVTLEASWRLPLHKVVIARWLQDKASELGLQDVTYCPNGLEHDQFFLEREIEGRSPAVAFLASDVPFKRLDVAVEVSRTIHAARPDVPQVAFGTGARPALLPEHVSYLQNPSRAALRALHNSSAVFLHSSDAEGWPLPPAEAMSCGAALVAAANPGVREYAVDDVNALLAPLGDVEGLSERVLRVLDEPELRVRVATRGVADIRELTWERAAARLLAALTSHR